MRGRGRAYRRAAKKIQYRSVAVYYDGYVHRIQSRPLAAAARRCVRASNAARERGGGAPAGRGVHQSTPRCLPVIYDRVCRSLGSGAAARITGPRLSFLSSDYLGERSTWKVDR